MKERGDTNTEKEERKEGKKDSSLLALLPSHSLCFLRTVSARTPNCLYGYICRLRTFFFFFLFFRLHLPFLPFLLCSNVYMSTMCSVPFLSFAYHHHLFPPLPPPLHPFLSLSLSLTSRACLFVDRCEPKGTKMVYSEPYYGRWGPFVWIALSSYFPPNRRRGTETIRQRESTNARYRCSLDRRLVCLCVYTRAVLTDASPPALCAPLRCHYPTLSLSLSLFSTYFLCTFFV